MHDVYIQELVCLGNCAEWKKPVLKGYIVWYIFVYHSWNDKIIGAELISGCQGLGIEGGE